jgi:hypothetical protein
VRRKPFCAASIEAGQSGLSINDGAFHLIIDTHAHALDDAFLTRLCRKPAFGLSASVGTTAAF